MDNVTHALAGCLMAGATTAIVERRKNAVVPGLRTAATVIGVLAAELPDADLLYAGSLPGMGKLGYLLHHRGYTHTIVFAIIGALAMWGVALLARRSLRQPEIRSALLVLAIAGTLSHLALDFGNNYGVHPFWPVNNSWYYGDAIFIVEPWLWVASLPALYLMATTRTARTVFGALLAIILIAAWLVAMVGHTVALALSIGTVIWVFALRAAKPVHRIQYGILAWLAVDVVFGAASMLAEHEVRKAVGPQTFRAVALTPSIGNPLCFTAQIVQLDGPTFGVSRATVAPFPWLRDVSHCMVDVVIDNEGMTKAAERSRTVAFSSEWNAPRAELQHLVATNCEIAAAMRFIRVPQWEFAENGAVTIADVRFGQGGSFAGIASQTPPKTCPRFVPPWTPPRSDILRTK